MSIRHVMSNHLERVTGLRKCVSVTSMTDSDATAHQQAVLQRGQPPTSGRSRSGRATISQQYVRAWRNTTACSAVRPPRRVRQGASPVA
jgi:hypothetical protein